MSESPNLPGEQPNEQQVNRLIADILAIPGLTHAQINEITRLRSVYFPQETDVLPTATHLPRVNLESISPVELVNYALTTSHQIVVAGYVQIGKPLPTDLHLDMEDDVRLSARIDECIDYPVIFTPDSDTTMSARQIKREIWTRFWKGELGATSVLRAFPHIDPNPRLAYRPLKRNCYVGVEPSPVYPDSSERAQIDIILKANPAVIDGRGVDLIIAIENDTNTLISLLRGLMDPSSSDLVLHNLVAKFITLQSGQKLDRLQVNVDPYALEILESRQQSTQGSIHW